MDLNLFREIGKTLLHEISKSKRLDKIPISVGASGDKTYPIDKLSEDIIISYLEKTGEPLTIISEELGIKDISGGGKRVIIDPIDGSRNAIAGIPFFCTSIAVSNGRSIKNIEYAYIINLINGDEFWAEKGKGSFLNGEKIITQQDDILYLTAFEAQSPSTDIQPLIPLFKASRKVRCFGAIALDLSYLASGSISIFVSPSPSRGIDFAAGILLVKEAGGTVTDLKGREIEDIEISIHRSTDLLIAGNKRLHKKALSLLNIEAKN
jgi:myo-inositol-1(or 4)-monophosphatase